MDAEQFRNLVDHDQKSDPGLEPDQNRMRDEIGQKSQSQERGQQQDGAHQHGQRYQRANECLSITSGSDLSYLGADQYRDRRSRAHAEHARSACDRVDQHRYQGRVEPNLQRQCCDRGISHRDWNDDCRRGQTGDEI